MRILLLTQHFPPDDGPHAYRWGWLASHFVKAGHQVDVIVPRWRDSAADAEEPGAPTVHPTRARVPGSRLVKRVLNEVLTAASAYRVARERCPQPDVVIGTIPSLPTLPVALLVGWRAGVPVVAELRDAWPDLLTEWPTWGDTGTSEQGGTIAAPTRSAMRLIAPLLIRGYSALQHRATLIVTTTRSWAGVLRDRRLPSIAVIRNSSMAITAPLPDPPQRPGNALHVLYVGNIGRAQHLATAIRAASICHRQGVPVRLRIFGTGAEQDAMTIFNRRLGEPAEIFDRIPIEEVPKQYAWADTLLISLRSWEPMAWSVPSKLYEALNSGRHITVTAPGESAQIVRATGSGDVVPPEDPEALAELWIRLANDRSLLQRRGTGPDWVAKHADRAELAEQYLAQLHDVAAR